MTAKIGKMSRKSAMINGERIPSVTIPFENAQGKFEVTIDNCGLNVTYEHMLIIHMIHDAIILHDVKKEKTEFKNTLKFRIVKGIK